MTPVAKQLGKDRPSDSDRDGSAEAASPIDWQVASSLTGGDRSLLDELIGLFPGEATEQLDMIRTAIDVGDAEALTRGAHTLKSAAGCFGAAELVSCARHVEELGRASSVTEAGACLEELEAETDRLIGALDQERAPA